LAAVDVRRRPTYLCAVNDASSDTRRWPWISFTVPADRADDATGWCAQTGSCGWQVEEGEAVTLTLYFADSTAARAALESLGERLAALGPQWPVPVAGELDDRDWAADWQRSLHPIAVTDRIVVHPPSVPFAAGPGQIAIAIEPRQAFGTGLHASTQISLQLLEEFLPPGSRCLDLGTGSGVLAIAAVALGATHVVALDTDPVAVTEAAGNLLANGVTPAAAVARCGGLEQAGSERFDLVVANLQSGILEPLVAPLREVLVPGGLALFAGLTEGEIGAFGALLGGSGWQVRRVCHRAGWAGLAAAG
jgi:ribosomal protein L11 methyltransferase